MIGSVKSRHSGLEMTSIYARLATILITLQAPLAAHGQQAPAVAERPWDGTPDKQLVVPPPPLPTFVPDPLKSYTLAELVDIAERNNPETRVAWENAKARAAACF